MYAHGFGRARTHTTIDRRPLNAQLNARTSCWRRRRANWIISAHRRALAELDSACASHNTAQHTYTQREMRSPMPAGCKVVVHLTASWPLQRARAVQTRTTNPLTSFRSTARRARLLARRARNPSRLRLAHGDTDERHRRRRHCRLLEAFVAPSQQRAGHLHALGRLGPLPATLRGRPRARALAQLARLWGALARSHYDHFSFALGARAPAHP